MVELIESTVVGAALQLFLFVLEAEEDAQRYYKFFASGALPDKLDRINWNELRTNFNDFMKCFQHPILVKILEDGDNKLFARKLQFMSKKELEKLVSLIIQQQTMNSQLDPQLHPTRVMKYYYPLCPSRRRYDWRF